MTRKAAGSLALSIAVVATACTGFRQASDGGPDSATADGGRRDAATADAPPGPDTAASTPCAGLPLKTTGFRIAGGAASAGSLTSAVARGHDRVALVWEDIGESQVKLAILDEQGTVKVPARVLRSSAVSPAIVASARGFVVVVHDLSWRDVIFLEVDPQQGKTITDIKLAVTRPLTNQDGYPVIARQGVRFGVLHTATASSGFELMFTRVREDGGKVDQWRVLPDQGGALGDIIATANGRYAAAWIDERGGEQRIYAARLDSGGDKLPPGDIAVSQAGQQASFPDLAEAKDGALQVCYDVNAGPQSQGDILCSHLDVENTVGHHERLTDNPEVSSFPAVVWTGRRFLAVYNDEQPGIGELFGQFFDADGTKVGPTMRLTEIPGTSGYPQIAWLDDGALISWYQYRSAEGWTYQYQLFGCTD